jgi:hypothetical protein
LKESTFLLSAPLNVQLAHPSNTAGQTIVCINLTFVLVETHKTFTVFVNFVIAALPKLFLLLVSSWM